MTQLSLLNRPDVRGMTHRADPLTSRRAAERIAPKRTALHTRVLAAFATHGPMTDETLERLPDFAAYGPSTIRKRRSELYQQGAVQAAGEATNSRGHRMVIWRVGG